MKKKNIIIFKMSNIEKKPKNSMSKKTEKGFSTALLLNISPFGENFKEPLEGVENIRLNTSATAAPGDNTSFMNDFLSFDLLQRIEAESPNPVPNETNPPNKKIPDVDIEDAVNEISNVYSSGNEENGNDNDNSDIIINKEQSQEQKESDNKETQKMIGNHPTKNQILNQLNQQQKNFIQQQQQGGFNRNQIPLYSYYDSTSKYLSQSFLDEKSKQNYTPEANSDSPMMMFKNMNNQMGMNFIDKSSVSNSSGDYQMNQRQHPNQFTYPYQNNQMLPNMYMNNAYQQEDFYDNMPHQQYMKGMIPPNMNMPTLQNKKMNENTNQNKKKKGDSGNNMPKQPQGNNKNQQNKKEVKEDDYIIEMFGRVGWICDQCNNFNYETRNKCNRCGIPKSPKKISKLKRKLENKKREQMKLQQQQQKPKTNEDEDKKKKLKERKGDWTCAKCGNLNFSFRIICNRCQIPKNESEMMIHNTNTNFCFNNEGMNQNMMYYMNQQMPMQFVNNGQIYCNNLNVMNQNNNVNNNYQYISSLQKGGEGNIEISQFKGNVNEAQ